MKPYFPVSLDLQDRLCLVVGGGGEAEGRIAKLLEAGARVRFVCPELTPALRRLLERGRIRWRKGRFQPGDLAGCLLAMLCVKTDPALTRRIFHLCRRRGILLCAYDQPRFCDFAMPAIVRRGLFSLAISTGGASPALARRLREDLEGIFDARIGRFVAGLSRARKRLVRSEGNPEKRIGKLKALAKGVKLTGRLHIPR